MLKSAPPSLSADGVAMSFPDGSCMTISVEVHNEPAASVPCVPLRLVTWDAEWGRTSAARAISPILPGWR